MNECGVDGFFLCILTYSKKVAFLKGMKSLLIIQNEELYLLCTLKILLLINISWRQKCWNKKTHPKFFALFIKEVISP